MLQKLVNSWYESDGLSLVAILICMCLNLLFTFFGLIMSLISFKAFIFAIPVICQDTISSVSHGWLVFCVTPWFLNCICATLVLAWHMLINLQVRIIKERKVYTLEVMSKYPWKHHRKNPGNTYINLFNWLIYLSKQLQHLSRTEHRS